MSNHAREHDENSATKRCAIASILRSLRASLCVVVYNVYNLKEITIVTDIIYGLNLVTGTPVIVNGSRVPRKIE